MIKNFCIYRISPEALPRIETLEEALSECPFNPCANTEPHRVGFVPVIDDGAEKYAHCIDGAIFIRLREQRRQVPAGALREELEKRLSEIQDREERKLGRKEIARLKDELIFSLLPRAFPKTSDTLSIIYPGEGLVVVCTSSFSGAESALNALRLALGSLPVNRPAFAAPIQSYLTAWLKGDRDLPESFSLGEACELTGHEGDLIRCKGFALSGDELAKHFESSREARRLQLVYDESITFTLSSDARFGQLNLSEKLFTSLSDQLVGDRIEDFKSELTLWKITIQRLLGCLLPALGETRG